MEDLLAIEVESTESDQVGEDPVKGTHRLLYLITEQGLVNKIVIAQQSLREFISGLSPGAYSFIAEVNAKVLLDNVALKPPSLRRGRRRRRRVTTCVVVIAVATAVFIITVATAVFVITIAAIVFVIAAAAFAFVTSSSRLSPRHRRGRRRHGSSSSWSPCVGPNAEVAELSYDERVVFTFSKMQNA